MSAGVWCAMECCMEGGLSWVVDDGGPLAIGCVLHLIIIS